MQAGDVFVVALLVGVAFLWLHVYGQKWSRRPKLRLPLPRHEELYVPSEDAVRLLNASGYEIVAGKTRLPITITVDGEELESRLFVDAFAAKGDAVYVVRLARERQPMEWSAAVVRDRLLVYNLLYPDAAGVLYVDRDLRMIRKIMFEVERD